MVLWYNGMYATADTKGYRWPMLDYTVFLYTPERFIKMADFFLLYLREYVTENQSAITIGITIHHQPEWSVFVFSATQLLITLHRWLSDNI